MERPDSTIRRSFVLPDRKDRMRIGRMSWLADVQPTVRGVTDIEFSHFGVGVTSVSNTLSVGQVDTIVAPQ